MVKNQGRNGQHKSPTLQAIPQACTDEAAAVAFLEEQRWGRTPACPRCGELNVYQMKDRGTGERSARWLWRCHGCKRQFTFRTGTVMEDSKIPARHWCLAFWRACSSKKGVSALQIKRETGLSYESALFLMHRIRFAMRDTPHNPAKLTGVVESDETWVGGRSAQATMYENKTPVVAMIQRGGQARAFPIRRVNKHTLRAALNENVDPFATLMTDEHTAYPGVGRRFLGGHETVKHSAGEYARGNAHCNSAESFFAILKRAVYGTWHSVSRHHLGRYVGEVKYRWNTRQVDDGQRLTLAIRKASGKRLMYRNLVRQTA